MNPDIIGTFAGICTTFCFFPQAVKIIRTKNTEGLSLIAYAVYTLGVMLWCTYGVLLDKFPIIFFNAVGLIPCLLITTILIRQKSLKR